MSAANDLFGPILTKALEAEAPEVIFISNSVPMFKYADDQMRYVEGAEAIQSKDLRIALNDIGGVELGFESMHRGWYQHEGQKFDLEIYHEPERTGASFKHVKQTDAPEIEKTTPSVALPTNIPNF